MNRETIYRGRRGKRGHCIVTVTENGRTRRLPLRTDLVNHSPTGFEWGYWGSGPAQLALAILAWHCGSNENRAIRLHQHFKWDVVTGLDHDEWTLTGRQVEAALQDIEAELAEAEMGRDEPASGNCWGAQNY